MMLWQEKWVTYLEGAHSFAFIYTPWVFLLDWYSSSVLYVKEETAQDCFDLLCSLFYADSAP